MTRKCRMRVEKPGIWGLTFDSKPLFLKWRFCSVHMQFVCMYSFFFFSLFFTHIPLLTLVSLPLDINSNFVWSFDKKAVSQSSRLGLPALPGFYFTWLAWQAALSFTIVSCIEFSYPEAKKCGNFLYFISFLQSWGPWTVSSHRSSGFCSLG